MSDSGASTRTSPPNVALTLDGLVPYLVERRLVSTKGVLDPRFEVRDYSRRNRNFKVVLPDRSGLLVKQAGNLTDARFRESLNAEAALLETVWTDDALQDLRWFAPRFEDYDASRLVLSTELIHPATSITKYHFNRGAIEFPEDAAVGCARVLAAFHRAGADAAQKGLLDFLPRSPPFVWDFFERAQGRSDRDPTGVLSGLVQDRAPFWKRIPDLKAQWARHAGLVHRDVRWDNFLLTHGSGPRGSLNLRLIDWEMASVGDPAWDVASYLGEYPRFWLSLLAARRDEDLDDLAAIQSFDPSLGHASARTFVEAYLRSARLKSAPGKALLARAAEYLPFVLVLQAAEMMQNQDRFPPQSRMAFELATQCAASTPAFMRSWFGTEVDA